MIFILFLKDFYWNFFMGKCVLENMTIIEGVTIKMII